ncbi:MAG: hypothetical protein IPH10_08595 [bacterium]|nr:hypothetical protein [bacterium]
MAREQLLDELLWDAALNGVNAQDRALIDVRIRMKGILNRTKAGRIGLSTEHNKLEVIFVCADKDEDDDEL